MVYVVAHRGWWDVPAQQNTLPAFARAFDAGIGVELDVRDCVGSLVVSHDPPVGDYEVHLGFSDVLRLLGDRDNVLAVNVKSCGLAPWFAKLRAPRNWFFFDLPPYEREQYEKLDLPVKQPTISNDVWNHPDCGQWRILRNRDGQSYLVTDRPAEAMEFFK